MSRLPTVGADNNDWGNVLNDYLSVSIDTDGSLKKPSIEASLTGDISSHNHDSDYAVNNLIWNSSTILFTKLNGRYSRQTISTDVTLTANTTGAINNACTSLELKGDGTHTLTLAGFNNGTGTDFDNSADMVNVILCGYVGGTYIYSILTTYLDTSSGPVTLSAPASFSASSPSTTQINLTWATVTHASSYMLEWSANGTSGWTQIGGTLSQATTSYNHTSLSTSTQYFYRISSIGNGTTYSTSDYGISNATTGAPTVLTIGTVTGTATSQTALHFTWTNVTNNSGYQIKISTDSGSTFGTPIDIAQDTNSYDITSLSVGTRRDVQVLTKGNGTSFSNSAWSATTNATTINITQLSTPTLNAPSVISSTEIDLSWSTVSNVTSWKLETSANGTSGWTQIGGTIAGATLSYNHTSLTAATAYYYRLTAVGNQTTYSNSSVSANVNATTSGAALTFSSAATSTNGAYLDITFNKNVASGTSGITLKVGGVSKTFTYSVVSNKLRITPTVAFVSTDVVTLDYSSGNVLATDGGVLSSFTGQSVTNNVPNSDALSFITEWNMTSGSFTFPAGNAAGTYNCTIDWGDGSSLSTVNAYDSANLTHTYASGGTYQIKVLGTFLWFYINGGSTRTKITKVINWGQMGWLSFASSFNNAENLTTLPSGPITGVNYVTSCDHIFYACVALQSIPADLYKLMPDVQYFGSAHQYNYAITTIPTDIFRYNTAVTSFLAVFSGCNLLASYGANLFKYNTLCTIFANALSVNPYLQLRSDTFYASGESGTRFLNQSIDFSNAFSRISFTGVQGTAPDIWNCDFGTGAPTKLHCFYGGGNNLTSIINYSSIPTDWA